MDITVTHREIIKPNDRKYMNLDGVLVKRVNRTHPHLFLGEFEMFVDFDDKFQILCYSYKKAGNEYKRMAYKFGPKSFCEFFRNEKMFYPDFQSATDLPELGTCPFPARKYHINGWQPNLSMVPPVFESGDYMAECQLIQDEEVVQGIKGFATVLNTNALK